MHGLRVFVYAARVPEAVSRAKELILDLLSRVLAPYLLLITNHFRQHAHQGSGEPMPIREVGTPRYKSPGTNTWVRSNLTLISG